MISNPETSITQFYQLQVNNGNIQFIPDGTPISPSYTVTVQDSCGLSSTPQVANIKFNLSPILVNNHLIINQNQTVVLNSNNLSAIDSEGASASIQFTVYNIQHGRFTTTSKPSDAITQFEQIDIINDNIQFIQDGSNQSPSYSVQAASITFDAVPVIINNQLIVSQGQSTILTSINLSAMDIDSPLPTLNFIVSNAQHGHFEFVANPGISILSFLQQDITNSKEYNLLRTIHV